MGEIRSLGVVRMGQLRGLVLEIELKTESFGGLKGFNSVPPCLLTLWDIFASRPGASYHILMLFSGIKLIVARDWDVGRIQH